MSVFRSLVRTVDLPISLSLCFSPSSPHPRTWCHLRPDSAHEVLGNLLGSHRPGAAQGGGRGDVAALGGRGPDG